MRKFSLHLIKDVPGLPEVFHVLCQRYAIVLAAQAVTFLDHVSLHKRGAELGLNDHVLVQIRELLSAYVPAEGTGPFDNWGTHAYGVPLESEAVLPKDLPILTDIFLYEDSNSGSQQPSTDKIRRSMEDSHEEE